MKSSPRIVFPMVAMTALVGTALIVTGCGSGKSAQTASEGTNETGAGRATFTIRWSERPAGRLVPLATNSIRIRVAKPMLVYSVEKVVARPAEGGATTVEFNPIPTGDYWVSVSAHPDSDGAEVALAGASEPVFVPRGQIIPLRLTMQSLIDSIEITAPEVGVLGVGQQRKYTVSAKSAYAELIMTHPNNLAWTIKNPKIATIAPDGTVTGIAPGQTQLEVRETESNKTNSISLEVR